MGDPSAFKLFISKPEGLANYWMADIGKQTKLSLISIYARTDLPA